MPEYHNVFFDPKTGKAAVFVPVSGDKQSWEMREFKEISAELTEKIKAHIQPNSGPYWNLAMQKKDSDTANAIPQIISMKWDTPEVLEQNQGVLSQVQQNQGFLDLVNV